MPRDGIFTFMPMAAKQKPVLSASRPAPAVLLLLLHLVLCISPAGARPKEDELRLEVARQWTEKGEYDKAVQELRLYLNEHPESPEIYARIGGLRMKQG